jgi:hypothetical protein
MTAQKDKVFTEDPSMILLKQLTVRALKAEEYSRAGELFEEEHYLGNLPSARGLLQVIEYEGRWVALLDWGPAALKLAARDEWIGWTGQQRAERLNLVVMNRRFLILGKARKPNLASRSLAIALKALAEHWKQAHGYCPLLAETFTDIEQFEGTCYKASGWIPCGQTKGFKRHRMDYYEEHKRPKKLWLKPLNRNTRRILSAMDIPENYRKALNRESPERDLPLKKAQLYSLRDWMREHLEDPRATNRSFSASSLLSLVAMALLAGRRNLAEIHRYGQFLTQLQRQWLGWPANKNGNGRKTPSYTALRNLLIKLDPHDFAKSMTQWLQSHNGTLPAALAVDGKWIRDQVLSVCLSDHETGAPVAIGFADKNINTPEQKQEGEQTVARRLYKQVNLENVIITGDALHNSKPDAQAILNSGGDYILQLKDERRHSYRQAVKKAQQTPLFLTKKSPTVRMDALMNAK